MSDVLHERYIVDDKGAHTGVLINMPEFVRLVQAASEADENYRELLGRLESLQARVADLTEEMAELDAFDRAMAAPPEDRETIPLEQVFAEIDRGHL